MSWHLQTGEDPDRSAFQSAPDDRLKYCGAYAAAGRSLRYLSYSVETY